MVTNAAVSSTDLTTSHTWRSMTRVISLVSPLLHPYVQLIYLQLWLVNDYTTSGNISGRYNYDWSVIIRLLWTFRAVTTMTGQWLYDFCEHLGPLSTYIYKIFSTFHIFEQNPSHMLPETSQMSGVCIMY